MSVPAHGRSKGSGATPQGGTLLEVLVSLIIITLVLSAILEVSAHARHTSKDARRSQLAKELALEWRSARLANAKWATQDAGTFPDQSGPRWTLEPMPQAQVSQSGLEPDANWRQLHIYTSSQDSVGVILTIWFAPQRVPWDTASGGGGEQP